MSTIILRLVKGTPLTNAELDANFTNLNTDVINSLRKNGDTMIGDLTLSTAVDLRGDFTNATLANRSSLVTSVANSATLVPVAPSGTGTVAGIQFFNNSNPTNAGLLSVSVSTNAATIESGISGTGAYVPLSVMTNGSEKLNVALNGLVAPGSDNAQGLGSATKRWASVYATLFYGSGANLTSIPNGALNNSTVTIGSTSIALGNTSTTLAGLSAVTSTIFNGSGAGLTSIPNTALNNSSVTIGTTAISLGNTVSGLTGLASVTSTNFYGAINGSGAGLTSIPNGALNNSAVTIGSTSISLGSSVTTIAGLSSVTSTNFYGTFNGNSTTATTATNVSGNVAIPNGGTGSSTAAGAVTNLMRSGYSRESNGASLVVGRSYGIYTGAGSLTMYLPTLANSAAGDKIWIGNLMSTWSTSNVFTLSCPSGVFLYFAGVSDQVWSFDSSIVEGFTLQCTYNDGSTAHWVIA